ncbi:AMP-binding protein [Streptomyces lydicus]|nr:AMP-binding protein [Streptomyces lydicus]
MNTVPSPLAELLRSGALPDGVRTVNLAGEPLPRSLADAVLAQPSVTRLMNLYGPTEATTYACEAEIRADDRGDPPIGRPVSGTHARVLDQRLRPVAPGVPGELYLGGPGLARGYLNNPALTAERFLPDLDRPGERMYRTGDLVRVDADGQLRYLGRADDQVKIRGFRIEPGECAAALRRHPDIADAAVLAREFPGTGTVLCAWAVPPPEAPSPRPMSRPSHGPSYRRTWSRPRSLCWTGSRRHRTANSTRAHWPPPPSRRRPGHRLPPGRPNGACTTSSPGCWRAGTSVSRTASSISGAIPCWWHGW